MNASKHAFCLFALLLVACAYSLNTAQASVISDPEYYVQAEITEIEAARGGLHTLKFKIKGLAAEQLKYGGHYPRLSLPDDLSDKEKIFSLQFTLNPEVTVKKGDIIVVGVIHGSSMGSEGPVVWTMFERPYLECGTPIGLHY